ncbi:MAG: ferritin family protein [Magnetococcales bacterium]|nr:ferritin family protein [Magnetococcales bacterium]
METATDFFKAALRNEVKASAFYYKAADLARNDESRMLLLNFADMEDGHARDLLEKAAGAPCASDFDAKAYLKELEDNTDATISDDEMKIIQDGDMRAILEFGIRMEANAGENYKKLAAVATNDDVKAYCLELVKEEKEHENELVRLLNGLDMDDEDRPGL